MDNHWYSKKIPEVIESLNTAENGLSEEEAFRRLKEFGPNKLPEAKKTGIGTIFLGQFKSPLIYILLAACIIVFIMGEMVDGSIILAVLFFNAVVGTIQEGKAQNTLDALKKFVKTDATVLRNNKEIIIIDEGLVKGDIIMLQEGEKVPADARVITSNSLRVEEAALTGESEPVYKISEVLNDSELPASEQKNMLFKGTFISAGNGAAVVVATGVDTFIGEISEKISTIDTEIPLKANIRYLSRLIIIIVSVISATLFSVGLAYGNSAKEMFGTVVSLSVSIIPEGLPIVMTLILATGVWRMSKKKALVKKLQAVEALGQARIIAVDKTGTITKNELIVKKIYADGNMFEIGGEGYEPKGEIKMNGGIIEPLNHEELLFSGKIAVFCSNARVMFDEESKEWRIAGDPTEAAMLVFSEKVGFHKNEMEKESPKLAEIPFDYKTKYHAVVYNFEGKNLLAVTGAPETILSLSEKILRGGKSFPLTKEERDNLESVFFKMSQEGMRVIAMASAKDVNEPFDHKMIKDLSFVGFVGMKDTLRPEAKEAVKEATSAGIKVVMITGDHLITAKAIAEEAGIYHEGDSVLSGKEIEELSDIILSDKIKKVSIFARVTPEHKIRIVQAYKRNGEIIAMTGDGVNDAPSLVAADLGVAMGKIGTEVAKQASDIVLLDDNFGNIVSAIEEGRSIYKTIKKVILYLFSTSFGEVFVITGAIFLGLPLPLLPAQIIWLNFVTDGFLDVALAMEPKEKGLLKSNFERPKKYLIDKLMVLRMFFMVIPMTLGSLYLFQKYVEMDMTKALTMSLVVLAVFQWFNAWNCKSENKSIFSINPFSNRFLMGATVIVILLQIVAVYNPVMQKLLHTSPLALSEWGIVIAIGLSIIIVEEIRKLFYRKFKHVV